MSGRPASKDNLYNVGNVPGVNVPASVVKDAMGIHSPQVVVFDDFNGYQNGASEDEHGWILNSGGDAQALDPTPVAALVGGVLRCTTGNADGTVANDGSCAAHAFAVRPDYGDLVIEARVKCVTNITTMSAWFGLSDSSALEEPVTNAADTLSFVATDWAGFHYDSAATTDEWWATAVDSGTADTGCAATGDAPVADTYQLLRMEVNSDASIIKFYIDNILVKTLSGGGFTPGTDMYVVIGANATTTTSKSFDVDYVSFRHGRPGI